MTESEDGWEGGPGDEELKLNPDKEDRLHQTFGTLVLYRQDVDGLTVVVVMILSGLFVIHVLSEVPDTDTVSVIVRKVRMFFFFVMNQETES